MWNKSMGKSKKYFTFLKYCGIIKMGNKIIKNKQKCFTFLGGENGRENWNYESSSK